MSSYPGQKLIKHGDGSRKPHNLNKYRPKGTPGLTMNYIVGTTKGGIISSALPVCPVCGNIVSDKKRKQTEIKKKIYHWKCARRVA